MKRFYVFPNRRATYRIIKVRHWLYTHRLQQRYRWLWFEWWHNVDGSSLLWWLQERKSFLESMEHTTERERVVEVTE